MVFGLLVAGGLLALAELALRLFVPVDALRFAWEREDGVLEVRPGASPGATRLLPKPNSSLTSDDGPHAWVTRIDANGFRSAGETRPSDPSRYRVLAVGDSWIFGTSTSQGHTFAERLEAELGAVEGRRAEVINAGVPSFGAFDMLVRYDEALRWLEVDAVLVGLPHNADPAHLRADQRARWYAGLQSGPPSEVRLYLALRLALAGLRTERYAAGVDAAVDDVYSGDLRALVADAQDRGLDVTVVAWPNRAGSRPPLTKVLGELQLPPVPVAAPGLGQRSCFGFRDEGHPSEAGAAAAAVRVAAVVRSRRSDADWVDVPSCDEGDAIGPGKAHAPPRPRASIGPR